MSTSSRDPAQVAEAASAWLLGSATTTEVGLGWTGTRADAELDPTLHSGAAGVLALACDRHVESGEPLDVARRLVDDLCRRATLDGDGARWSNVEHRVVPSELEPRAGWAMGNAGILRELLRYLRLEAGGDPAYAVDWPDQPAARPAP